MHRTKQIQILYVFFYVETEFEATFLEEEVVYSFDTNSNQGLDQAYGELIFPRTRIMII